MQANSFDDHAKVSLPSAEYTTLSTVGGVTSAACWAKEENAIKLILGSMLPNTMFNRIKLTANVHNAWEILKRVFEERSKVLVTDIIQRFRNKCCEEDKSVRNHFEYLADLCEQLAAMGKVVTDEDYTDTLLALLPASYDGAVSSMSASACLGMKVLTSEIFKQFILDESKRQQVKDKYVESRNEALAAESGSQKGKDKSKDKKKVECYNCHKTGHYKSECWAKGGGKEGQGPRRGKGAKDNAAPAEEKSEETKAWAAIKDIEEPESTAHPEDITATVGHTQSQPSQGRARAPGKLYNSRASHHMSPFGERFTNYRSILPRAITAADKRVFYAVGTGDLRIEVPNGESSTPITLKDVLHALDMGITIVSVSQITRTGCKVVFDADVCHIFNKARNPIGAIRANKNGLYKAECVYAAATPEERVDLATLHRCLAHIAPDAIRKMVKRGIIEGIKLVDDGTTITCEAHEQAKATCKEIWKEREAPLTDTLGAEVHSDVWGPSPIPSLGGRRYYVTFTDDYSRHTWLTAMRTKDETLAAYKAYAAWLSTQHGVKIKWLRSDRGGEYTGGAFSTCLADQGTERWLTLHDKLQHNGVVESLNHHLMERVHAFLIQAALPKSLWAEAAHFVIWLKNHTTTRVIGNATPLERASGHKPNLAGLPKWGQRICVHSSKSSKLQKHAMIAHWIGYNRGSPHILQIYWPEMRSITMERNVRFTADFTTVYTLPGPIQDLPPITSTPNAISQPTPQAAPQTPPAQSPQSPQ